MQNRKGNNPNYALLYELYYGKKPDGRLHNKLTAGDQPAAIKRQKKAKPVRPSSKTKISSPFQTMLAKVYDNILKLARITVPAKKIKGDKNYLVRNRL